MSDYILVKMIYFLKYVFTKMGIIKSFSTGNSFKDSATSPYGFYFPNEDSQNSVYTGNIYTYNTTAFNHSKTNQVRSKNVSTIEHCDDWVMELTLSQKKPFYWRIDFENNIDIRRKFKKWSPEKVSSDVLYELNLYMSHGNWQYLANNVEKLYKGAEIEGLGSFLYNMNPNTSFAQLSSHLGAIFTTSGVWECDKSEGRMKFRLVDGNWNDTIREYYEKKKSN